MHARHLLLFLTSGLIPNLSPGLTESTLQGDGEGLHVKPGAAHCKAGAIALDIFHDALICHK